MTPVAKDEGEVVPAGGTAEGSDPGTGTGDAVGTVRVCLSGEIDMAVSDQVHAALGKALTAAPAVLEVDLAKVSFMDSSGLALVVEARHYAASWGGQVRVVNPRPQAQRLLQLTQLAGLFGLDP